MSRAAVLLILAVTLSAGASCSVLDTGADGQPTATSVLPRPDRYTTCPPSGIVAPSSMTLVDRELPNLGDGTLGRHEVYRGDGSQLEIVVGENVLENFEDLDFDSAETTVNGLPALASSAGAFGTSDRLVVLSWTDPSLDMPCAELTLVGTNLAADELVAIASAERVTPTD